MSGMPASRLLLSRIAGRFHDLLLDDAQATWQRSRAHHHGHGVGVFEREATRYHPRAAQDRLADHGDREHLAVENDREWLPHIVLGDLGEAPCAMRVEPERRDRLLDSGIESGRSIGDIVAL